MATVQKFCAGKKDVVIGFRCLGVKHVLYTVNLHHQSQNEPPPLTLHIPSTHNYFIPGLTITAHSCTQTFTSVIIAELINRLVT